MEAFLDVITDEFNSVFVESTEREKNGVPLSAEDFKERFVRIATRIYKDVGMIETPEMLTLLYLSYKSERLKGAC